MGGDAFAEGRAEAFLQSDGGQGCHAKRTFSPVVESFFARFKWEGRDQFLEAKSLEELRGVVEERLRYYHGHGRSPYLGGRLHSGLGYRTPKEVMDEVLGQSAKGITREAG